MVSGMGHAIMVTASWRVLLSAGVRGPQAPVGWSSTSRASTMGRNVAEGTRGGQVVGLWGLGVGNAQIMGRAEQRGKEVCRAGRSR